MCRPAVLVLLIPDFKKSNKSQSLFLKPILQHILYRRMNVAWAFAVDGFIHNF